MDDEYIVFNFTYLSKAIQLKYFKHVFHLLPTLCATSAEQLLFLDIIDIATLHFLYQLLLVPLVPWTTNISKMPNVRTICLCQDAKCTYHLSVRHGFRPQISHKFCQDEYQMRATN